jgi:hypothetical protein
VHGVAAMLREDNTPSEELRRRQSADADLRSTDAIVCLTRG